MEQLVRRLELDMSMLGVVVDCLRPGCSQAFVPAPRAESPSLRGLAAAASIAAAPGVASAGDEYLNYNMTGRVSS